MSQNSVCAVIVLGWRGLNPKSLL